MAQNPTEPNVLERFVTFFQGWLVRQQSFLEQLHHSISSESANEVNQQKSLIVQVLAHYQEYYEEKAKLARQDVLLLFCPPWLSSFERTLLWAAGYKPSLILRIVDGAVKDLTDEQTRRMEEVKAETKNGEKELTETLARLQQSVAAPPMVALARRIGRIMDGEISSLDSAIEALKTSMLRVLEDADSLRKSTVSKVVEILSPVQTLKFLAAAAQFQLQVRRWGMERDSQKAPTGVV